MIEYLILGGMFLYIIIPILLANYVRKKVKEQKEKQNEIKIK